MHNAWYPGNRGYGRIALGVLNCIVTRFTTNFYKDWETLSIHPLSAARYLRGGMNVGVAFVVGLRIRLLSFSHSESQVLVLSLYDDWRQRRGP
jgi:hypothetical protein